MNAAPKHEEWTTVDEYLYYERSAGFRHELVLGRMFAMAGGSKAHNRISGNIYSTLLNQLRGKRCSVFIADVKLKTRSAGIENFYYPDVMVSCDPRDGDAHSCEQPTVVFEVLSPSTSRSDRAKFIEFQSIDALQLYVLIEQESCALIYFQRIGERWVQSQVTESAAQLPLDSIGCQLSLAQIYEGIDFTAAK